MQKKTGKRTRKAFLLLLTARTFVHKAWVSALENRFFQAEVFSVVVEEEGKSFEMALNKALDEGFRDISIFRFGKIPAPLMRKIPGILEMSRRTCLEADFNYGVVFGGEIPANTKIKKGRFLPRK